MAFESRAERFMAGVEARFRQALDDAADEAGRRPGSPADTRAEILGRLHGRIGSSKRYARAQERGAFIRPRRARALKFVSGRFAMSARLPAQRYLERTGRRWGQLLLARLR